MPIRCLLILLPLLLAGAARAEGLWQPLQNDPSCVVWDENPKEQTVVTWTGGCINGRASGNGTLRWSYVEDGTPADGYCSGAMRNGKQHGQAACVYSNGGRYEGGWSDGRQHGKGVEVFADGGRYEGAFQMGVREGRGVYTFDDGGRYDGDWHDGMAHGQGIHTYSNGARYEGGWAEDRWHGHGTVFFADGARCEGDWQDGALVGQGIGFSDGKATTCSYDKASNQVNFAD